MAYKQLSPKPVAEGGTGAITLTGVLTGNGTSAITANTVTQYGVLVGGASNAVDSTAVGTATHVLTSNGAGLAPTFQAPSGGVSGPGSSTDNALARWDGTGGDTLQDSTVIVTDAGEMTNASQPAFLAYLASSDVNETGNGTAFILGDTDVGTALTEVFDQGGDFTPGSSSGATFTAPVTGRYLIGGSWYLEQLGAGHVNGEIDLVTSNRTFFLAKANFAAMRSNAGSDLGVTNTVYTDMDASDTFTTGINVSGSTKTVDIGGSANPLNAMWGQLIT